MSQQETIVYENLEPTPVHSHSPSCTKNYSFARFLRYAFRSLFKSKTDTSPHFTVPVEPVTMADINALPEDQLSVIRFGHSSVLMKIANKICLLDPVFDKRCSPVQFFGPKRFHDTPIDLNSLSNIDIVACSHNHFDHLDSKSIAYLAKVTKKFITPVGNGKILIKYGVSPDKIVELEWWDHVTIDDLTVHCTPAQHYSGRSFNDRNLALWSSFAFKSSQHSVFFSGDSAYFKAFKQIGKCLGPFDLTMIECGAYNEAWSHHHMMPEQSIQAHLDLNGHHYMPIHNVTFSLAPHRYTEPFERSYLLSQEKLIPSLTPKFDQVVTVDSSLSLNAALYQRWWT